MKTGFVQEVNSNEVAQTSPQLVTSSGISLRLWRLYAQAWLICFVFPITSLTQNKMEPVRLLVAVTGLVIFVVIYTWFMWPHPLTGGAHIRPESHIFLFAGLVLLALVLTLVYGIAFLWLFVGVSAVAGVTRSPAHAFWIVMLLTLLTLGMGIALEGGLAQTDWLHIIPLVLLVRGLGLDMAGLTRLADALRELHTARGELARRAVAEERLRLARDLHDLLGHNLSLIILKSELAGRLIDREPDRAEQEIDEVERVARRALREVREAVAGYRQPTLATELDGALQMLDAAGVVCTIENSVDALAPAFDTVLAWTVREGVTNVIRHSRARHCTIRVNQQSDAICVEVINDSDREEHFGPVRSETGSGLPGLNERVIALGGRLEAGQLRFEDHHGFRLWVELPLQSSHADKQE